MQEQELRYCPLVKSLRVMPADDPRAQIYLKSEHYGEYVEVTDMFRLHDLLHRDEYQPVAILRFHQLGEDFVRVYFRQLHTTEFLETSGGSSSDRERFGHPQFA
ncbi:MAG: hypothetical protein HUJ26_21900 [Planctomycetaceae bacterium]|nr:hypothetical protein [Planctomycetaceae bacterium]